MNSEENNEKQIEKLNRMEKIYADEEKHESVMDKIEFEDGDICAEARKIVKWAVLITWLACAFTLVTGGDFSLSAAGILFSGGIYLGLCVTKFLHKKKKGDAVISALGAAGMIALGILLLVSGGVH